MVLFMEPLLRFVINYVKRAIDIVHKLCFTVIHERKISLKTYRHLGRALVLCMSRCGLTGMDAAARVGISQSCMARLIGGQRRADPESLSRLSHSQTWGEHAHAGHQIMIGHLMDELERSGWESSDILMRARGSRQYALRALHEIEAHIVAGDEAVAEVIAHIADILRRSSLLANSEITEPEPLQAVAESPAPYQSPKRLSVSKKNSGKK